MTTRMDKAYSELEDKSPFVCESCDVRYGHGHEGKSDKGKTMEYGRSRRLEDITTSDPTPFGP